MSLGAVGSASQARLGAVTVNRVALRPPPIRFNPGPIAMIIFGVIFGGLGGSISLAGGPWALGGSGVVIGAGLIGWGIFGLVRRAALLCGFTVHERGVVITRSGSGSDQLIPYSQVSGFSLKEQPQLSNGTYGGMLRTLRFTWPEGRGEISQFADANHPDTFAPVVEEILGKLADAAKARQGTGAPLAGKGWTLDSHGLSVRGQAAIRLSELGGIGTFEDKISLWRPGEELPFFSVPDASPNARVLGVLAQRELAGRERPSAGELGRILFQKAMGPFGKVSLGVLAALFALSGVSVLFASTSESWLVMLGVAAVLWAFAAFCAASAISRFRVHELGVTKRSLFGFRSLRYSEIVSFQFGAVRQYYNGAYTGTTLTMQFTPGPGGKAISHNQTVRGNDSDLDSLREQVSRMVAAQLFERLRRGEEFHWGPTARFTPKGLVVRASKLFGSGEPRLVPYDAGMHISIDQGTCHLFLNNEEKAAMRVECAAHNFYPGLKVLSALLSAQSERATG